MISDEGFACITNAMKLNKHITNLGMAGVAEMLNSVVVRALCQIFDENRVLKVLGRIVIRY